MDGPAARRSALVDRLTPPRWYHPAQGGALALLVASFATGTPPLVVAALVTYLVALNHLPKAYRRATGVWLAGEPPPTTRRWARGLAATAFGAVFVGAVCLSNDAPVLALIVAGLAYALVQVLGRRFDTELRARLREDPDVFHLIEEA